MKNISDCDCTTPTHTHTQHTHTHTHQPERNKHSLHTNISMHKQFTPCGVHLQRWRIDERNHNSVTITSGCRSGFKSVFLIQNSLTYASRCHWKRQGVSISCTFGSQHSTKEPSVRNILNKESHLAAFAAGQRISDCPGLLSTRSQKQSHNWGLCRGEH